METNKMLKGVIIQELMDSPVHALRRSTLIKKMAIHTQDVEELDEIMQSFHEAGMIMTTEFNGVVMYIMPEGIMKEFRKLYATRK